VGVREQPDSLCRGVNNSAENTFITDIRLEGCTHLILLLYDAGVWPCIPVGFSTYTHSCCCKSRGVKREMADRSNPYPVLSTSRASLLRRAEYPDPLPLQLPRGLTRNPQVLICPYCCQSIQTSLKMRSGTLTWLACAGICLLGGGAGCCLLPFCAPSLLDCEHYCPSCERFLGRSAYITL
jgi:lipopolysaccharide-induced tumor necrosis factor-alpha factor